MPKITVVTIILIMFLIDLAVSLVNYRHRKQPIPELVKGVFDDEKYKKWLAYSMETLRLGLISAGFSTLLVLVLLLSGAFGWLERLTNAWFNSEILRSLAFLAVFMLFTQLLSLPFAWYRTFVIEEKYGFNKTTYKTFFLDLLKGMLVSVVLGGLLVAGLHALFLAFSQRMWLFILLAWLVLSIVMMVMMLLNRVFIKLFNKLTPLPDGELKVRIKELAKKVGFKVNAIFSMDASRRSSKLNAFFSGLGKKREVVLYDTLLEKLDDDEIVSVLAHELGHAKHKDTLRLLVGQILIFGIYLLVFGLIAQSVPFAQAFGLSAPHFGFSLMLLSILLEPLDLLLSIPLNAYSRQMEYAADAFAAQHASPQAISSSLIKLAQENLSNLNPHPLYVWLHYNHPTLAERLAAINKAG